MSDIPKDVPYLLIGGGTASFAAFRAIKSHEPKAKVVVISNELEMPYMRPPLSKEIWLEADKPQTQPRSKLTFRQWNGVERSIFYEPDDFYTDAKDLNEAPNGGVTVVRGYHVKRISVDERKAVLDDGTEIQYGKCLIATGSVPKTLEVFDKASAEVQAKVSVFKTIADFEMLSEKLKKSVKSVVVVGGGFLGSEMACALAKYGGKGGAKVAVHQVFREKGNMGKVLPAYLSHWTTERVKDEGVTVHNECNVVKVEAEGKQVRLSLSDSSSLLVDHVIVAVGSEPNTELAEVSQLETDAKLGGYIVNAELLARNNVYVAGDASNFYDPHLGRRRVEHHDHAVVSGRLAGENMVGLSEYREFLICNLFLVNCKQNFCFCEFSLFSLDKPYTHQSMFWSDLGPRVGYEAIGVIDASLKTVAIFAKSEESAEKAMKDSESETATTTAIVVAENEKTAKQSNRDEFDKGVVLYLRGERIVGILLWNVFNRINIARKVIAEDIRTTDYDEVAKLFNIYEGHE